ncbi:hypothetical protein QC763_602880 [Podospora pseudopauciseta]|uniref:Uncharacterized protein n=1 Tax=Podospora pseudopauciseta TaxID=2093780 RepID=A0ABR0H4N0_9PEZI|nr:hypothetical protein QC763_602880 [Podospora pseudopauciseta]
MPTRPSRLPRRISHSTPPSTTYARDYTEHDDDHDSSRGRRRGRADDHHHRRHRRRRSVESDDGIYHDPRDRRSHKSRGRGRSVDSDDDTYRESREKRSRRSQRRDRSTDSEDSTYHGKSRHQSRRRDRSIDSQDKRHHSHDEETSRRGRHRSVRHPLRGSHRSPSRSSSASSSSSESDFDRVRDPSPRQPGRLHRLARSVSRLGRRRKPSVSSRSRSRSCKGREDSHVRSRSHPPHHHHSSSKHNESHSPADIIYTAARTAFEAGAVAALKLRDDPSPLIGAKGGKIVAAAVGAAVVDTFIDQKHPKRKGGLRHTVMRQATQMAIGNIVMPAVIHADKRHGKGVPVQTSVRGKSAWFGNMKAAGAKAGGGVRAGGGRR